MVNMCAIVVWMCIKPKKKINSPKHRIARERRMRNEWKDERVNQKRKEKKQQH